MEYRFELNKSISDSDLSGWRDLCRGHDDAFMDPEFIAANESALANDCRFWTLLVRDPQDRPAMAACLTSLSVDAAVLSGDFAHRCVARIRRLWPGYFKFRVLLVGLPVSAGQSSVAFAQWADRSLAVQAAERAVRQVARESRACAVVWKEFDESEVASLADLTRMGYLRADSLPMNQLEVAFRSFEEYCSSLRSKLRYDIRRSQRKLQRAGFHIRRLDGSEGADQWYSDTVHRLHEAVVLRSSTQLQMLPAEFFRELARRVGKQAVFYFAHKGERTAGVACALQGRHAYELLFTGFDDEANRRADLFFNLVYARLDEAMRSGAKRIHLGQNADTFKARLGATQRRRWIFARGCGILKPLLHVFGGLVFRPIGLAPPRQVLREATPASVGSP
ncbi:MAG: GNAT family N-acetyltransferase [Thermoguttaceae bacterium]|jgi:predicted N-acyltransferase|nr:GNAT family N-acetyltransferase [Thermoguttaceae bacterium]